MGTWGRGIGGDGPGARRPWEGDGRIDLRSVANVLRQLPYHVAWVRGFRETAGILNPTVAIDQALENVREMQDGVFLKVPPGPHSCNAFHELWEQALSNPVRAGLIADVEKGSI